MAASPDHSEYGNAPSIQDQLHDLSTYTFPRPSDPEEDTTGRAAFRAISERIDHDTRQTFLRFPSASILDRLEAVDTISFRHCGLGDKGIIALGEALKVNQTVTSLDLSENGVTHKGLTSLLGVLPKSVRALDLSGNRLTRGCIISLSSDNTNVGAAAAAAASPFGGAGGGPAVPAAVQNNASGLNPQNAAAAAGGGGNQQHNNNNAAAAAFPLTAVGSASSGGALTSGTFQSPHSGTAGYALGQFIGKNTTLQTLSLKGNKLNDTDCNALAEGLSENATLVSLDLSCNELGPGSANALATILLRSELRELNLEWNKLQNSGGVTVIKEGLPVTTVKRIFLGWNGLGDEAAEHLGKVMIGSSSIEELDISNNHIGPKGAEWLGKGVRVSMALSVLVIHDNPLTDEGCMALLKAVMDSQTLNVVDMRATGAGPSSAEMLPTLLNSKPPSFQIDMPRQAASVEDEFQ